MQLHTTELMVHVPQAIHRLLTLVDLWVKSVPFELGVADFALATKTFWVMLLASLSIRTTYLNHFDLTLVHKRLKYVFQKIEINFKRIKTFEK